MPWSGTLPRIHWHALGVTARRVRRTHLSALGLFVLLLSGAGFLMWGFSRPLTTISFGAASLPELRATGGHIEVTSQLNAGDWLVSWTAKPGDQTDSLYVGARAPGLVAIVPPVITFRDSVYVSSDFSDDPPQPSITFGSTELRSEAGAHRIVNELLLTLRPAMATEDSTRDSTWLEVRSAAGTAGFGIAGTPARTTAQYAASAIDISRGRMTAEGVDGFVSLHFLNDGALPLYFLKSIGQLRFSGRLNTPFTSGVLFWIGNLESVDGIKWMPGGVGTLSFYSPAFESVDAHTIQMAEGNLLRELSLSGFVSIEFPTSPDGTLMIGGTGEVPVRLAPLLLISEAQESSIVLKADGAFRLRLRTRQLTIAGEHLIPRRLRDFSATLLGMILASYVAAVGLLGRILLVVSP